MAVPKGTQFLGERSIGEAIEAIGGAKISGNVRYLAPMERKLARTVFEDTIPYSQVIISDGKGLSGRAYTTPVPLTSRKYVLHLGDGYHRWGLPNQSDRDTLIHELTHVWQGEHSGWSWVYVFSSAGHQILGNAYDYDKVNLKDWDDYNPEQQAQIVEDWFHDGKKEDDRRYRFIVENIRGRMMTINVPVHEDTSISSRSVAHDSTTEASDDYLVRLLERRYDANDVAGFGGRVKTLEQVFRRMSPARAQSIRNRLEVRRGGDKMSMYFHDHLSTATRGTLLGILRQR